MERFFSGFTSRRGASGVVEVVDSELTRSVDSGNAKWCNAGDVTIECIALFGVSRSSEFPSIVLLRFSLEVVVSSPAGAETMEESMVSFSGIGVVLET